jgi:hypothetical protein
VFHASGQKLQLQVPAGLAHACCLTWLLVLHQSCGSWLLLFDFEH